MTAHEILERGREAYGRRAWAEAYARLTEADALEPLGFADLQLMGLSAELMGRPVDASEIAARAHQEALRIGDRPGAARAAFWLGFGLMNRGEFARGGGWISRAKGVIDDPPIDCVEQGYVLVPGAVQALDEGRPVDALATFDEVARIAARFGDSDLATMGRLGRGNAFVDLGEVDRGVAILDEAMVAVTGDEVSPLVVGIVYCAAIDAFQRVFDLRRAQEWTAALTRWCEAQPELAPFRGRCLLYQAELLQFHGEWQDAIEQTQLAYDRLSAPPPEPAVAEAFYQQGELHRLRGEFGAAEGAYLEASQQGRPPEPGLALLRLARGEGSAALAVIRRAVAEARDGSTRARLLGPYVEIALAVGDVDAARDAARDLAEMAASSRAPLLLAMATRADGAVALAEGDADGAIATLRRAWSMWRDLEAPFETARVRVLIAQACGALGDKETAEMEFDAALQVFRGLGAAPELARVEALSAARRGAAGPDGLTTRELEVLRLVAAGLTNRAVATELVISEKTVARHLSNIYTKLDLSSRSAATAYAYEHGIRRTT